MIYVRFLILAKVIYVRLYWLAKLQYFTKRHILGYCWIISVLCLIVINWTQSKRWWIERSADLKDLKNILQNNQYPLKSYLNDKINCRNEKSIENTEWEIKIRYFKLPFIGLHFKLMQKKIDQLCKRFCISLKFKLVLQVRNYDLLFQQKIHIKVNIFLRLFISLFVLAVMLVMSVRLANIWQPE